MKQYLPTLLLAGCSISGVPTTNLYPFVNSDQTVSVGGDENIEANFMVRLDAIVDGQRFAVNQNYDRKFPDAKEVLGKLDSRVRSVKLLYTVDVTNKIPEYWEDDNSLELFAYRSGLDIVVSSFD